MSSHTSIKNKLKPVTWVSIILIVLGILLVGISFLNLWIVSNNITEIVIQIIRSISCVMIATGILRLLVDRFDMNIYYGIERPPPSLYLKSTKSQVYMLGITLKDFHDDRDCGNMLIKMSDNREKIAVNYRFLLLYPLSLEFSLREKEENVASRDLINECHETLRQLMHVRGIVLNNNKKNKCSIKFYVISPRRSTIIADKDIFVGPYFFGKKGSSTKWMQIINTRMSNQYRNEFDEIWDKSSEEYLYEKYSEDKIENGYKDLVFKPIAIFTADLSSDPNYLTVTFIDQSMNNPTSWKWTFGDGETAEIQHPTHTYNRSGSYSVELKVKNSKGEDTKQKNVNIPST